jgi:Serine acetyltransferase, N-terminal
LPRRSGANRAHARISLSMEPEDREFMRELLLRHEKATDAMIARLDKESEESRVRSERIRAEIKEIRTRTDEWVAEMRAEMRAHRREFVDEMRAQRQALFRVLDRLDGQGA